jgi:hypothetical protein
MTSRAWQSWSGAIGLAFVFVALFLPGPPPKTSDTAAALTANLVGDRAPRTAACDVQVPRSESQWR